MRKILVAVILLCLAMPAVAQQSVQLSVEEGSFAPYHPDVLVHGQQVVFSIRVVNQSPEACSFTPSFGWHVYSPDGALWSNLELVPTSGFVCSSMQLYTGSVDGAVDDSIGIVCPDAVIIDGYDEIAFEIRFTLSYDIANVDKTICIDTIGYGGPTGFQWVWTGQGCDDVIPSWLDSDGGQMHSGGRCFQISLGSQMPPEFDVAPDSIAGSHCEPISAQFSAYDPDGYYVEYAVESGPGEIDPNTGLWTWNDATLADVGETIWVEISATDDWLTLSRHAMRVVVTNEAPTFTSGCKPYPAVAGERTEIPLSTLDNCSTDPMEFSVLEATNVLGEYGFTDSILWYVPVAEDRGDHRFTVAVTDGVDMSTCDVFFEVAEANCCGLYTNFHTGNCDCDSEGKRNLSDITVLVNYVYLSHWPLCCPENGNVDGDVENKINLGDITRLIDHVYLSQEETAVCQ